ncbi:RAMP superfamily CRISPR-associated protein [Nitrosomonas aestuarii]|uniref:RAMP superfamily CRISPR-associated protein n=1 Tax=Nitrosomonas aestuarii TaxID=52441 RepID=UPI0011136F36|nr:RAMP superfamily CRISPR-associated protein [Nitrosomonas aestuarii]
MPSEVILHGLKLNLVILSLCDVSTDTECNSVLEAVRWWDNFGGVGARTRRGLGSIAIDDIKPLTDKDNEKFGCIMEKDENEP